MEAFRNGLQTLEFCVSLSMAKWTKALWRLPETLAVYMRIFIDASQCRLSYGQKSFSLRSILPLGHMTTSFQVTQGTTSSQNTVIL